MGKLTAMPKGGAPQPHAKVGGVVFFHLDKAQHKFDAGAHQRKPEDIGNATVISGTVTSKPGGQMSKSIYGVRVHCVDHEVEMERSTFRTLEFGGYTIAGDPFHPETPQTTAGQVCTSQLDNPFPMHRSAAIVFSFYISPQKI